MIVIMLLISNIAWGLWPIFDKKLIQVTDSLSALFYYQAAIALMLPLYGWIIQKINPKITWSSLLFETKAWGWSFLVAVCVIIANIAFLWLLTQKSAGWVASMTVMYPIVTMIMGLLWFSEVITVQKFIGATLVIVGIMCVSI